MLLKNEKVRHLGYKHPPLIDLSNEFYVIEILHQFLRVTDLIIKLFFNCLTTSDKCLDKYDPEKHPALKALSEFLINKLKCKGFSTGFNQKQMLEVLMSMQGPQKKTFFKEINLFSFPAINRHNNRDFDIRIKIASLFKTYWDLHFIIRDTSQETHVIEKQGQLLMKEFLAIFSVLDITPYLHVTCFHLSEQYEALNGRLKLFSTEGLEKLNDLTSVQFFRGTNKKNYIAQILQRDRRMDMFKISNMDLLDEKKSKPKPAQSILFKNNFDFFLSV